MKRIEQSSDKQLAFTVLTWIVYATRPLKLQEVLHAEAIDDLDSEDESIKEDCLTPPSRIINACAGLVRIDKENNVVGLVHKTIQEYFDENGNHYFPHAHRDIARSCLQYLSLPVFRTGYCPKNELFEVRIAEHALLHYAVRSIGVHISQGFESSLKDLALRFFSDEQTTASASQVLHVDMDQRWWLEQYSQHFPKRFQGVHLAAYFGLTVILNLLLATGKADIDSKDNRRRTPLIYAAISGHEAVVKLLLATGKAEIDSKDNYGQTPLWWAAIRGHEAVVKLLLATGKADIDLKDTDYGQTPFSLAAEGGHEAVVELLLATGKADIDSKDSYGQTPLSWAAREGHEAVVKLLLATGKADIDSKNNNGRTPLLGAAKSEHEDVVKLILATGKADID